MLYKILMGELIGKRVKIIKSSNINIIGLQGKVIDETKNTFIIETSDGQKIVPKKENVFRFYLNDHHIDVPGTLLTYRPHERIKKYWRRYYRGMQRQKLPLSRKLDSKGNNP